MESTVQKAQDKYTIITVLATLLYIPAIYYLLGPVCMLLGLTCYQHLTQYDLLYLVVLCMIGSFILSIPVSMISIWVCYFRKKYDKIVFLSLFPIILVISEVLILCSINFILL